METLPVLTCDNRWLIMDENDTIFSQGRKRFSESGNYTPSSSQNSGTMSRRTTPKFVPPLKRAPVTTSLNTGAAADTCMGTSPSVDHIQYPRVKHQTNKTKHSTLAIDSCADQVVNMKSPKCTGSSRNYRIAQEKRHLEYKLVTMKKPNANRIAVPPVAPAHRVESNKPVDELLDVYNFPQSQPPVQSADKQTSCVTTSSRITSEQKVVFVMKLFVQHSNHK